MKDTIHGYILLEPYAKKIVDSKIFQRLGYIKQLTSACYVFPNANHTRKEHSIGVGYICNKYGKHLFPGDEYKVKILTIAGLLHDVMHGPWSHSWDSTVYIKIYPHTEKGHDIHRYRAVREVLAKDLYEIGVEPEDIINIWNGENNVMNSILKSALNADRMDFVNRDTVNTGTTHFGSFEIDRIIMNTSYSSHDDSDKDFLIYDEKIMSDAIQGLSSRLFMYKEVYLHKTVVSASILIELMLIEACDILDLVNKTKNMDQFIYLTDGLIFNTILHSDNIELSKAKKYAEFLYFRKLPKMISEKKIPVSNGEHHHQAGTSIDSTGEITWTSRILSNDFCSEFTKYNIHIKEIVSGSTKLTKFGEYWDKHYPRWHIETYYIERKYKLSIDE